MKAHVHFIGIGGIGVSALAFIYKSRGYEVSGSDMKESLITEKLRQEGIKVFIGHRAENLGDASLLIYSAAIHPENPEIIEAQKRGIEMISRAKALGNLMTEYPLSLAVSGTHGKTTTTSMVSLILERAGLDPTILVGGILKEFESNVKIGAGEYFVAEACEYVDSFLQLNPKNEIILNIDSDHLDYFKDINAINASFEKFAHKVPEDGCIIAYDSNPFVEIALRDAKCKIIRFGYSPNSDFYAKNIRFDENGFPFYDLYDQKGFICEIKLSIPGEHNVLNSMAASAAALLYGVEPGLIKDTLKDFCGTQRRFEIIGRGEKGFCIMDDYAHHPTEIKATLAAVKKMPYNENWCIFQPHTYTRLNALFSEFADAFLDADHLILSEIYAAREKNIYKLSSKLLAEEIKKRYPKKDVIFIDDFEKIAAYVKEKASSGDLVITLGAGDICKIDEMLLFK